MKCHTYNTAQCVKYCIPQCNASLFWLLSIIYLKWIKTQLKQVLPVSCFWVSVMQLLWSNVTITCSPPYSFTMALFSECLKTTLRSAAAAVCCSWELSICSTWMREWIPPKWPTFQWEQKQLIIANFWTDYMITCYVGLWCLYLVVSSSKTC